MELVGVAEIDGKPCYEITANTPEDGGQTLYFDVATGLLLQQCEFSLKGDGETVLTMQEYFEVGGIKQPRRIKMQNAQGVFDVVFDEVLVNQEIPGSVFALPPEVARLAKKRFVPPTATHPTK